MFRPDLRDGPNLFYFNNENFYHGTSSPIGGRKVLARIDGPLIDRDGFLSYVMSSIGSGSKFEGL
jgi:hypothetical protein